MNLGSDEATKRRSDAGGGVVLVAVCVLAITSVAQAQRAEVRLQEGPHYVGEPFLIRVVVEGLDKEPRPVCDAVQVPEGLTLTFVDATPNESSFQQRVNGRVVTSETRVVWSLDFHSVARKPGVYRIPAFTVKQNARTATTAAVQFQVQEIQIDGDMRIVLILPDGPVYPGQRAPVTIQWWYAGDFNNLLYNQLTIRSPLFEQFKFIDPPRQQGGSELPIVTDQGMIALKATVTKQTLDGRPFLVVSATRTMVIEKAGEYELPAIAASVPKVTRWRRDVFGGRRPAAAARVRAIGEAQKLVIEPLPLAKAPSSFARAVGRGFGIDVKTDRSVVRVGDPIELTVTIRGDGDLGIAGLPPLSVLEPAATTPDREPVGLDTNLFGLPDNDVPGKVSEDGTSKQFVVTARIKSESVSQIPRIAYSWFDPQKQSFQTAYSDPIALQVKKAQTVGASDVVSAAPDPQVPQPPRGGGQTSPRGPEGETGTARVFDLTGADLAIQTDPARLLRDESQRFGGFTLRGLLYGASVVLIAAAWFWRRAAQADPKRLKRRHLLREQLKQIHTAAKLPRQAAAGQIASALRHIAPLANGDVRGRIDGLLAECDVVAYAPAADDSQRIGEALHRRALNIVHDAAREAA